MAKSYRIDSLLYYKKNISQGKNNSLNYFQNISQSITNSYYRNVIQSLHSLEEETIKEIEELSGWDYNGSCFLYKNKFRLNEEEDEIIFDVNQVYKSQDGYTSVNLNETEFIFIEKYKDLLRVVSTCEDTINEILRDYCLLHKTKIDVQEKSSTPFLPYYSTTPEEKRFITKELNDYIENYTEESLYEFLYFLNELSCIEDKKDFYENTIKKYLPQDNHKKERNLLFLLFFYLNGGNTIYNMFYEDTFHSEKQKVLSSNIEE